MWRSALEKVAPGPECRAASDPALEDQRRASSFSELLSTLGRDRHRKWPAGTYATDARAATGLRACPCADSLARRSTFWSGALSPHAS